MESSPPSEQDMREWLAKTLPKFEVFLIQAARLENDTVREQLFAVEVRNVGSFLIST